MTHELDGIFADLGLSQYLDAFVDQGFDAWDIILDIQESDLDALGVKLGHRRKLQRRIANARGVAPSVSLASSAKPSTEEPKQDGLRRDPSRTDASVETSGVTKRKYRRHPKPDDNAPERPPSAYVLFSNKMREDLKSQNLTFTEIAKLVGENWQNIQPIEKETFESQANAAKEKYHLELAEYKKTPEYRKYAQYLHDFKDRQAKQQRGQDSSKRSKVEPARLRHGSTSSSATPNTHSSTGSSEHLQGSEPPPTRRDRVNSTASMVGSQYSSTAPTPISAHNSYDDVSLSPRTMHFDSASPTELHHRHPQQQTGMRGKSRTESMHQHLPSLSDMLEARQKGISHAAASEGMSQVTSQPGSVSGRSLDGMSVLPRVPSLRHDSSSNDTNVSGSSVGSFGRPHGEASLPIHALLSDRGTPGSSGPERQSNPILAGIPEAVNKQPQPRLGFPQGPSGYGFQSDSSPFSHMKVEQSREGDVVMTTDEMLQQQGESGSARNSLDGMDALLRAGEIVGRGGRR
ncbi:hypothetical protein QQS21_004692 [Conoideocrella luteorostrata]|uniref:HMG box domain-containing protein n=1 Tax=Conoideocrella luteorostrata TaxID=1105319 RepID=A0AAJ0CTS6_9HYPO|nr:hypothetical protein QQS21_004692 [Conoideocrella luteorostrata]